MPEALSFCLARAQRPLLHVDRTAHLEGNLNVLSAVPDQQLLSQDVTNLQTGCLDGLHTAGVTPRLELVKDKSTLYLGEVRALLAGSTCWLWRSRFSAATNLLLAFLCLWHEQPTSHMTLMTLRKRFAFADMRILHHAQQPRQQPSISYHNQG